MNRPILLVEDDPNDVIFMTHAMQKAGISNPLHIASDGREALAFLRGSGKYFDRDVYPMPWLVLLDLRLPHLTGFEVLKWVRERPQFQTLVVIIFTSSVVDADVERAYHLGANAYIPKPSSPSELVATIKAVNEFWSRAAVPWPQPPPAVYASQPSLGFEVVPGD